MNENNEMLEDEELDLKSSIEVDLKEYNSVVDVSKRNIDEGITAIEQILKSTTDNYNAMIKNERSKFSMATAETARSIATLVKEKVALTNLKVTIVKTRLENNMKTRTLLKELEKIKKLEHTEGDKSTFNPVDFISKLNNF